MIDEPTARQLLINAITIYADGTLGEKQIEKVAQSTKCHVNFYIRVERAEPALVEKCKHVITLITEKFPLCRCEIARHENGGVVYEDFYDGSNHPTINVRNAPLKSNYEEYAKLIASFYSKYHVWIEELDEGR